MSFPPSILLSSFSLSFFFLFFFFIAPPARSASFARDRRASLVRAALITSSGIRIGRSFFRVVNEKRYVAARADCAMRCHRQTDCFFFAIGEGHSCRLVSRQEESTHEKFYKPAVASVELMTRAWSAYVPGFLRVNGLGHPSHRRGFSLMELKPELNILVNFNGYDTHSSEEETLRMRNYMMGLSSGTIVVGITADEAMMSMHKYFHEFKELGLDLDELPFRGHCCFMWQKGNPSATVVKIQPHRNLFCRIRVYRLGEGENEQYFFVNSMETYDSGT